MNHPYKNTLPKEWINTSINQSFNPSVHPFIHQPIYLSNTDNCHHSNYQMLKQKVFFVSFPGLKKFCCVYYQSKVHNKHFGLMARLQNIISWRLLVTTIYTCCTSIKASSLEWKYFLFYGLTWKFFAVYLIR